jgi:hypothetical protein
MPGFISCCQSWIGYFNCHRYWWRSHHWYYYQRSS